MHIESLPLERLKPAPYNPRKPLKPGSAAYRRLERSLREFDLVQPLVWNKTTGHLVSGHQRLDILKAKGVTHVEAVVVELSLEKEQALNIALNNSLVGSEWDAEKLIDVVRELQETEIDVALTGFDAEELADLLLMPDEDAANEDDEGSNPNVVRVQFEVPAEDWDAVRVELDAILAEHEVRVHVRLPTKDDASAKRR
jgi:ParB-like chromosome segregation protein Spo0J